MSDTDREKGSASVIEKLDVFDFGEYKHQRTRLDRSATTITEKVSKRAMTNNDIDRMISEMNASFLLL